jgi:hypothetical protein
MNMIGIPAACLIWVGVGERAVTHGLSLAKFIGAKVTVRADVRVTGVIYRTSALPLSADQLNRNLRNPRPWGIHGKSLPIRLCLDANKGGNRIALYSRFNIAVPVLAHDFATLSIFTFEPIAGNFIPSLFDIGLQVQFVGLTGAKQVKVHRAIGLLNCVSSLAPYPFARTVGGFHRAGSSPHAGQVV